MSGDEGDIDEAAPPRVTDKLFGHAATEAALLSAYRSGRVPHAFMLIGQKGIGKATLAYRMARFVFAHSDPAAAPVHTATSLAVDPQHPVARRVAARAHGDLLVLERTPNEKGVLRQQIAVDDPQSHYDLGHFVHVDLGDPVGQRHQTRRPALGPAG